MLFYNKRCIELGLCESARLITSETVIFWQKERIPFREHQHCIVILEALCNKWRMLQKSSKRKSATQEQKDKILKKN